MKRSLLVLVLGTACAGAAPPSGSASRPAPASSDQGRETRRILKTNRAWALAYAQASASTKQLSRLEAIDPSISVLVVYGEWCPDSRREVPKYWKALDQADVKFESEFRPVDRSKMGPGLEDANILYVPTFIVRRNGAELGRIVESAETDLLDDLLALMEGRRAGVLSGRPDTGKSRTGS